MLLIAGIGLFCRHYSRLSRDRANLQLSRDRAQLDLQMMTHQRARAPLSERSFPESQEKVGATMNLSSVSLSVGSLPPGPPSSMASSEQEVMHHVPLTRTGTPSVPSQLAAAPSTLLVAGCMPSATMEPFGQSSAPHGLAPHGLAPYYSPAPHGLAPHSPAPPNKTPAPAHNKAAANTAYLEFCRVTRPLLPKSLRNAEREKAIGERWKALSAAEKASYKRGASAPNRKMSAAARTVAARRVAEAAAASAALRDDTYWNAKRHRTTTEATVSGTITTAPIPCSLAAPAPVVLAAPSCPRNAPMSTTLTSSVTPYPPAREPQGLHVALEASRAPSIAVPVALHAPPDSLPALPADLARMFDEPTALAAPPAAAPPASSDVPVGASAARFSFSSSSSSPPVASATPTIRPSFATFAAPAAAAPSAPVSSADERNFELMVTHALEHMSDEEAAEVLLDSCLSADDQQLIFPPGLSPSVGQLPLTATQCG